MKLEFALTLDDVKAAEKLHIKQKISRKIGYTLLYAGVPVLAILGWIGFYVFDIGNRNDLGLGYSIIEVMLVFEAIYIPIDRARRLRKSVGRKDSKAGAGQTRVVDIDEEKISAQIPGVTRTEIYWAGIVGIAQNERIVMLYVNNKDFFPIPQRAFSQTQRAELNDLVARHVPARKP